MHADRTARMELCNPATGHCTRVQKCTASQYQSCGSPFHLPVPKDWDLGGEVSISRVSFIPSEFYLTIAQDVESTYLVHTHSRISTRPATSCRVPKPIAVAGSRSSMQPRGFLFPRHHEGTLCQTPCLHGRHTPQVHDCHVMT